MCIRGKTVYIVSYQPYIQPRAFENHSDAWRYLTDSAKKLGLVYSEKRHCFINHSGFPLYVIPEVIN